METHYTTPTTSPRIPGQARNFVGSKYTISEIDILLGGGVLSDRFTESLSSALTMDPDSSKRMLDSIGSNIENLKLIEYEARRSKIVEPEKAQRLQHYILHMYKAGESGTLLDELVTTDWDWGNYRDLRELALDPSNLKPSYKLISKKIHQGRIRKKPGIDMFASDMDEFADYIHMRILKGILLQALNVLHQSMCGQKEMGEWFSTHKKDLFSDDRPAFVNALSGLQIKIGKIPKKITGDDMAANRRLTQMSCKNIEYLLKAEDQFLGEIQKMWETGVGEDYSGEEPHFMRQLMRQREIESQQPKPNAEESFQDRAKRKAATTALKLSEGRKVQGKREAAWGRLQEDIKSYQESVQAYNRLLKISKQDKSTLGSSIGRSLVNGYRHFGKNVEGVDKQLSSDIISVLTKIGHIDDQERLVDQFRGLSSEYERILKIAKSLGKSIGLTRPIDFPTATEYIQSNYDGLRGLVSRLWSSRDEVPACGISLYDYLLPIDSEEDGRLSWHSAVEKEIKAKKEAEGTVLEGDVYAPTSVPAPEPEPSPEPELNCIPVEPEPEGTGSGISVDDAGGGNSDGGWPSHLPKEAVGGFEGLGFSAFRLDRRRTEGFVEINLPSLDSRTDTRDSDEMRLRQIEQGSKEEIEQYLRRHEECEVDWGRLNLLFKIARVFKESNNPDHPDPEFYRTASRAFRDVPPYFIVVFKAHGKTVCVADSPIKGNAIYAFRDDISPGTWREMIEELTKKEARDMGGRRVVHRGGNEGVFYKLVDEVNNLIVIK